MTGPQPPIDALEAKLIADGHRIRRIFFRDLILDIPIGVHESEMAAPQRVSINVSLYVKVKDGENPDVFSDVFDYDKVKRRITSLTDGGHVFLQETLVDALIDTCLGFEEVLGVRASSQKLDVYENCAGVGIEMVRMRA
jgi:dihydroneopterin aldolase